MDDAEPTPVSAVSERTPILNSPYEEPQFHYHTAAGTTPTEEGIAP